VIVEVPSTSTTAEITVRKNPAQPNWFRYNGFVVFLAGLAGLAGLILTRRIGMALGLIKRKPTPLARLRRR